MGGWPDTYHTHVWPEQRNLQAMAASAARSRSASSKTMKGAFPPSSMLTFFMVSAASRVSILPTPVEPVKLSFLMMGFVASSVAAARSLVVTTWSVRGGMPASTARRTSARHVNGVSDGGLMTTAQPTASAGATLRVIMAAGKFHGVMIAHVPTGCLSVSTVVCGVDDGIVSPYARGASSANHATKLAAYAISPRASASVFPFSSVRIVATGTAVSGRRRLGAQDRGAHGRPCWL